MTNPNDTDSLRRDLATIADSLAIALDSLGEVSFHLLLSDVQNAQSDSELIHDDACAPPGYVALEVAADGSFRVFGPFATEHEAERWVSKESIVSYEILELEGV